MAAEYEVPTWLAVMRSMTGMTEVSGGGDNPWIMHMSDAIAREYPEQAAYCALYTGDDVAWCGLTVAYCMTLSGIEPVYGDTDTERWMWALAWSEWPQSRKLDVPQVGCGVAMEREGGGHVTLFEGWDGNNILCRGGNQSDQVKVSSYDPDTVVAYFWPLEKPRPTVSLSPTEMQWVQASLNLVDHAGLDIDGEVGPLTREATSSFQQDAGLPPTGVADFATRSALITRTAVWNLNSIRRPRG